MRYPLEMQREINVKREPVWEQSVYNDASYLFTDSSVLMDQIRNTSWLSSIGMIPDVVVNPLPTPPRISFSPEGVE